MNYDYIDENIRMLTELKNSNDQCSKIVSMLIECFNNKHKVIFAGNGGSATDAMHFATDLLAGFRRDRKFLAAISLTSNQTSLTAIANDYGYDEVFTKQLEALGNKGDVFIGLSTSGKSKNVLEGLKVAKEKGLKTIIFTGKDVSLDANIVVNIGSNQSFYIQNVYYILLHMICLEVEKNICE